MPGFMRGARRRAASQANQRAETFSRDAIPAETQRQFQEMTSSPAFGTIVRQFARAGNAAQEKVNSAVGGGGNTVSTGVGGAAQGIAQSITGVQVGQLQQTMYRLAQAAARGDIESQRRLELMRMQMEDQRPGLFASIMGSFLPGAGQAILNNVLE